MSNLGESIKYFAHNGHPDVSFLDDLFTRIHANNADITHITSFLTSLDLVDFNNSVYDELSKFLTISKFQKDEFEGDILIFELNNTNLVRLLPSLLLLSFCESKVLVVVKQTQVNNFAQMLQLSYVQNNAQLLDTLTEFNFAIIESKNLLAQKNFSQVIDHSKFGNKYKLLNLTSLPFKVRSLFLDHSVLKLPKDTSPLKDAQIFTLDQERNEFINNICGFKADVFDIEDSKNLFKTIIKEVDDLDKTPLENSWIIRCAQNILLRIYGESCDNSLNLLENNLKNRSFSTYLEGLRKKLLLID